MLFLKYRTCNECNVINLNPNVKYKYQLKRSLQAQVTACLRKRSKRVSCFVSLKGSATVEAALIFPVFLCAMTAILLLGQLILTEANIQYAICKTADVYAIQTAVKESSSKVTEEKNQYTGRNKGTVWQAVWEGVSLQMLFHSIYQSSGLEEKTIRGGKKGIIVWASEQDNNVVKVQARYYLKLQVPFLGTYSFYRQIFAQQRVFNGYEEREFQGKEGNSQGVVYVTKHGTVYHTSLSCSHICRKISGGHVKEILDKNKYDACEKCIKKGEVPSVLYVTVYGNKYHSSLNCSGLKRTVQTVNKEETEGMELCRRCASRAD